MREFLLFVIGTSPLWFGIYCARNADEVLMPYKMFNIVGRFKSFVFFMFFGSGVLGLGLGLVTLIYSHDSNLRLSPYFLSCILCIVVGVLIYRSIAAKCPAGPLKNRLAWSMIVSGCGSIFRVIFFFINIAAEALEPKKAIDNKGRTIYIFPDDNVYDEVGNWVGKKTDTDKYIRTDGN